MTTKLMIETRNLRVDYGPVNAVNDVNLQIPEGEIFGLIGPNGAGKTSIIRVLSTLLEPTFGSVFIGGKDIVSNRENTQNILGYMPDFAPVYASLKVWEFLDLFAHAYRVSNPKQRVEEVIHLTKLHDHREVLAGTLSRGWTQRLVLAKTLLHNPRVLLLDEPAGGLDPGARIELRELLKKLSKQGTTVLISSHILTELKDFCTSIGMMRKGQLVVSGRIEEVLAGIETQRKFSVRFLPTNIDVETILNSIGAHKIKPGLANTIEFEFTHSDEKVAALLKRLIQENISVVSFAEQKLDVEGLFLKIDAEGGNNA